MYFFALNSNPSAKLSYHVRILRYPNLKIEKTCFYAIFEVILLHKLIFSHKTRLSI